MHFIFWASQHYRNKYGITYGLVNALLSNNKDDMQHALSVETTATQCI